MRSETGLVFGFLAVASTVLLVGFLLLVVILAVAMTSNAGAGNLPEDAKGMVPMSRLPLSLNAFYPPAASRPVYLHEMLTLETSFSGIVVDLMEDDLEGARESFEDFQRQYRKVAGMVPEWTGEYAEGTVKKLGTSLAAGDRGAAMQAFAAVGGICHRCHLAAMVPVQQKYHWGDFGSATVRDPMSGTSVGYSLFKRQLSANLAGITRDLRQGQADNARKQYEEFRLRFDALEGSCVSCHERKSRYFVDREMRAVVEKIERALQSGTVAVDSVTELVREIGRESCSKCHLVHLPAALAGSSHR